MSDWNAVSNFACNAPKDFLFANNRSALPCALRTALAAETTTWISVESVSLLGSPRELVPGQRLPYRPIQIIAGRPFRELHHEIQHVLARFAPIAIDVPFRRKLANFAHPLNETAVVALERQVALAALIFQESAKPRAAGGVARELDDRRLRAGREPASSRGRAPWPGLGA